MSDKQKITIVGCGYVGMSLSVLLSEHNRVKVFDIDEEKVAKVNNRESTIYDKDIDQFIQNDQLRLSATSNKEKAYKDAELAVIATPTNYNNENNQFDTSSVDSTIKDIIEINSDVFIVIKSTIPVGHTELLREKYNTNRIIFSPEFLREGRALHDNLYPSRIIIGGKCNLSKRFGDTLKFAALKEDVDILFTDSTEAEAIKLFSNTYLAMRVSFFNELDTFAISRDLNTKQIIDGVCLDERINDGYNNPSFGYGGYCLPKDTKQLLANYDHIPQNLIQAIVSSNSTRKDFITNQILERKPEVVGFFGLTMKKGSDNYRSSAIQGIMKRLRSKGVRTILYEPLIKEKTFYGIEVINEIEDFKNKADLIITNRFSEELIDCESKVYTRDIFGEN